MRIEEARSEGATRVALRRFVERTAVVATAAGEWPPRIDVDPDSSLRCAVGPPDAGGMIPWAPTIREEPLDLADLERAIGPVHLSVRDFFGTYWSCTIAGLFRGECVYLATIEDELRERETLQRWIRAAPNSPLFVAHYGDDRWIGADARTGRVSLQDPGRPEEMLAESLPDWLDALEPLAAW
jgi:hypothetical protein